MKRLTREEAAGLDRTAMERYGIPGLVLMENAGAAVAREALRILRERDLKRVVVICGRGNNGGDGLVAARHLVSCGVPTSVFLLFKKAEAKRPSDAAAKLDMLLRMAADSFTDAPVEVADADGARSMTAGLGPKVLIIDAILGTGLSGRVEGTPASAIDAVNRSGAFVLSVDIPSGLDADEGTPHGSAVKADATVTFVAEKAGFANPAANEYLGRVVVAEIGCGFLLRGR